MTWQDSGALLSLPDSSSVPDGRFLAVLGGLNGHSRFRLPSWRAGAQVGFDGRLNGGAGWAIWFSTTRQDLSGKHDDCRHRLSDSRERWPSWIFGFVCFATRCFSLPVLFVTLKCWTFGLTGVPLSEIAFWGPAGGVRQLVTFAASASSTRESGSGEIKDSV